MRKSTRIPFEWIRPGLAFVVFTLTIVSSLAGDAPYSVTDLGTLGGYSSQAFGLNNRGQVVGASLTDTNIPPSKHAFLYTGGVMNDLGVLSGTISGALGINNAGQVVGYTTTTPSSGNLHAFLYSGGLMSDLGTFGGIISKAYAINNNGQVVGTAYDGANIGRAFLYSEGMMTDLGLPSGSAATAINDSAQITGWFVTNCNCAADNHAFLYQDGDLTDLGGIGALGNLKAYSADGINNNGQIVGSAENSSGTISHPYLYSGGTLADLSIPGGISTNASVNAINNFGQIVGKSFITSRPILYSGGVMSDLNALIDPGAEWTLITATAINDNGQIAGYGTSPSGQQHAFLLTPRPVLQPIRLTAGHAQVEIRAMTGATYRVEYALALPASNWTSLTNLFMSSSPYLISDPSPVSGQRYYRAVQVR